MNIDELIAKALKSDLENDIELYNSLPDHHFSLRFKRKMRKLLSGDTNYPVLNIPHFSFRRSMKLALIVMVTALITGAAFVAYKLWDNYRIRDMRTYSFLDITNIDDAPTTIKEHYSVSVSTDDYCENVLLDDEYNYWVEYTHQKNGTAFSFQQTVKSSYKNVFLNTEDALENPSEILIGGYRGIYFETHDGEKCIIWDQGDYILDVSGYRIGKNILIKIAESVQKVE